MRVTDFGRDALSHVSLIKFYSGYSHVSIEIETGRTHQIRVHLSYQKLPIIGDSYITREIIIAKNTEKNLISYLFKAFLVKHYMPQKLDFHL